MSENMITYKVLWVDDDLKIVQPYQTTAEDYDLELIHKDNWIDAEAYLNENFDEISAIILDANCKISKEMLEEEIFIPSVLPSLQSLFGKKQRMIPWYILSAGTMDNFDFVIKSAKPHHALDWGNMLYLKDLEDDNPQSSTKLLENIQSVVKDSAINIVLFRYKDVFKYIGANKLIDNGARRYLLQMLGALYYPEENIRFQFEGNPLRKVMEYIFRAAFKIGLLPIECFVQDNQLNLLESNRYMSGCTTKYSGLKYGTNDETIFPEYMGEITRSIINFGSAQSHTSDENEYTINDKDLEISDNEKELFFSYVLQLCHVVKSFGAFAEINSNKAVNKAKIKVVKNVDNGNKSINMTEFKDRFEGKTFMIERDNSGNFHCECCKLSYHKSQGLIGKEVELFDVKENTKDHNDIYPVYAQFKLIEN